MCGGVGEAKAQAGDPQGRRKVVVLHLGGFFLPLLLRGIESGGARLSDKSRGEKNGYIEKV